MSRIRGKDTTPEKKVRSHLFKNGFRFRKNVKELCGKPDIVLHKYKTVIFINGCFWHHHENCKYAVIPKTKTDFWIEKFARNKLNDKKNFDQLSSQGWNVITIWECELKNNFEKTLTQLIEYLNSHATD